MATPLPKPAQGASLGLCLVSPPPGRAGKDTLEDGDYAVIVESRKIPAALSLKPSPKIDSSRGNRGFDDLQSPLEVSLGNHQGR